MTLFSPKYDDPNFTTVDPYAFVTAAGANNKSPMFTTFAARTVKSVSVKATTASTSADTIYLYQISGTSTTTNTLGTVGSGVTSLVNFPCGTGNSPPGISLNSGDTFYVQKGTDATVVYAGELETRITVGANLTL